jgi:hypothetical protein
MNFLRTSGQWANAGLRVGVWALALALLQPALAQGQQAPHSSSGRHRPPSLAMGAAFAPDGALWMVALDEQQRLLVQTSADEGRSWGPPRLIDTAPDKIAADGENRPKLVFGPRGQVVIAYTEPLDKPYTGRIRMLRSDDGGRSFSAPFTVHRDQQVITHRFESVAFDGKGILHTVWIDKRDLEAQVRSAAGAAPAASDAEPGGRRSKVKVDYAGAALYRNESSDGGRSFGPDLKLADHSCECCRIALAPAPDGSLVALWRHVFAPNERDHAFAPLGGPPVAAPVRATEDHWAIDACPHHGPGLAPAASGGYHAVWFGERSGLMGVRYGQLGATGAPRGEMRLLPDDAAEHAAIMSAGAAVAIVWRSYDGQAQATRWRAWVSQDDGRQFSLRELGQAAEDNDHPLLARRGEQIYALWRTTRGVRVEPLLP